MEIDCKLTDYTLPLVSIACITYNHEKYIRQCLEGFVKQKTDFKFEIVIHDDASTDKTAEVIRQYWRKYPELFKPILQNKNKYSEKKGILKTYVYPKCEGKYIALCEGDDYWTDPLKLQKQVDFLEANPEYGMCYTQCKRFKQNQNKFEENNWGGPSELFSEFWKQNCVPTLTVVYRKDLCMKYVEDVLASNHNWKMGDYPMWLWFSHKSKIKFINEVTGIYRVLEDSASHSKSLEKNLAFAESSLEIKKYFNDKFNYGKSAQYFERNSWFMQLRSYSLYNQYRSFASTWISGIFKHPTYLGYKSSYQYLLFFLLPCLRRKRI